MIIVNGKSIEEAGHTAETLLSLLGFKKEYVVIEYNGAILPRADYDSVTLQNGDVLEIVTFVGGG